MAYRPHVSFPGVSQIVSCSVTIAHGITPSSFRLVIVPQASTISAQGDLVLQWEDLDSPFGVDTLTIPDCIVDTSSLQYDGSGALVSLVLFDRRWKWKYGTICGRYNLRNPLGEIVKADLPIGGDAGEDTERTPRFLAALCLQAMGEIGYDVLDLPNTERPMVDWDYVNPAQSLEDLCEELGCRVVLQLDNTVAIRVQGTGDLLPATSDQVSIDTQIDPPERPDRITVYTAWAKFQYDFELQAVGIDTDGRIKPLNELGYAPGIIWDDIIHGYFDGLNTEKEQELAKKSAFRWFEIRVNGLQVPGLSKVINRKWLISDILNEQVDTVIEDGIRRPLRSWVYGIWYREKDGEEGNSATTFKAVSGPDDNQIVDRSWSYDEKRKIIKFGQPIYRVDENDKAVEPLLRYRTAFYAIEPANRCTLRYYRTQNMVPFWGLNNTAEMVIHREDLVPTQEAQYSGLANDFVPVSWSNNLAQVASDADGYISIAVGQLVNRQSGSIRYAGLKLTGFELDGAIQQVTWDIETNGAYTQIYRNVSPGSRTTTSFEELRILRKQRKAVNDLERQIRWHGIAEVQRRRDQ